MVYLIHFEHKHYHAQHYIGYTKNYDTLNKRMNYHKNGKGAKLLKTIHENNIDFYVVRIWSEGDRNFERKLKKRKNTKNLCPFCNPLSYNKNGHIK